MTQNLPRGLTDTFLWSPEKGYGWHSRPAMRYEGQYFAHYQKLDATEMGRLLTKARLELVSKYCHPCITTDIGIGGGRYVFESSCTGFDVCEDAVAWLKAGDEAFLDRYRDPYENPVYAATCWDSLEHVPDPERLLAQVTKWLFVSLPLCESAEEWQESKHFKPGEHLHYWTLQGFIS